MRTNRPSGTSPKFPPNEKSRPKSPQPSEVPSASGSTSDDERRGDGPSRSHASAKSSVLSTIANSIMPQAKKKASAAAEVTRLLNAACDAQRDGESTTASRLMEDSLHLAKDGKVASSFVVLSALHRPLVMAHVSKSRSAAQFLTYGWLIPHASVKSWRSDYKIWFAHVGPTYHLALNLLLVEKDKETFDVLLQHTACPSPKAISYSDLGQDASAMYFHFNPDAATLLVNTNDLNFILSLLPYNYVINVCIALGKQDLLAQLVTSKSYEPATHKDGTADVRMPPPYIDDPAT